ncbi:hypothetical protein GWI33_001943 [Rhynchophorus ferrugineus]|uniref:Uncharacterized protein n=1 Tax=Rhynchophorus ferrugineus TaxID=354439 RepID=A0A834MJU1_RHYFE|nr:hypothetical protein GWI33_001943 [Rhynchophorus ferrugineus]
MPRLTLKFRENTPLCLKSHVFYLFRGCKSFTCDPFKKSKETREADEREKMRDKRRGAYFLRLPGNSRPKVLLTPEKFSMSMYHHDIFSESLKKPIESDTIY